MNKTLVVRADAVAALGAAGRIRIPLVAGAPGKSFTADVDALNANAELLPGGHLALEDGVLCFLASKPSTLIIVK